MPIDLRLDPAEVALFTDLYELTVGAAFFEHGFNETASFEVAMRRMPPGRGFMVAAGIERLIEALEEYRFDASAIEHLESLQLFKPAFLEFLSKLRFTGSIRALSEGTIYFPGEPIAEIRAPLIEAQLIETLALNQLGFASVVATKAARCFAVAGGRRLVDFGPRRAQGADASLIAARSSYMAGFHGTANVLAGKRYGIPVFGTMSHSFVMAHESERDAFSDFVASFPTLSTLLVDTYDTIRGVENAAAVAARVREAGVKIQGIRLDSGDLHDSAAKRAGYSIKPASAISRSSRAAISTNIESRNSSTRARRSTRSASAPRSPSATTRRRRLRLQAGRVQGSRPAEDFGWKNFNAGPQAVVPRLCAQRVVFCGHGRNRGRGRDYGRTRIQTGTVEDGSVDGDRFSKTADESCRVQPWPRRASA